MATAKTFARLSCPLCGSSEGSLNVNLNDPTPDVECGQCSETFSPAKAVELAKENLRRWLDVVAWLEDIPT
jgi:hypothetical protein